MPPTKETPYTQIIYLSIPAEKDLNDPTVAAGHSWSRALDVVEQQTGFVRLSWGRSPEDRTKVQLHTSKSARSLTNLSKVQHLFERNIAHENLRS